MSNKQLAVTYQNIKAAAQRLNIVTAPNKKIGVIISGGNVDLEKLNILFN